MGRRPKFSREAIAEAARDVIADSGLRGATISAIANRLGAPSGSIYHRYRSRELLLAELWLSIVERFQQGVVAELEAADPLEAAVSAAVFMPRWVRANFTDARLLLVHHREDFVPAQWPEEVVERATALEPQLERALRRLCRRMWGAVNDSNLRRLRFALLDAPFGAVKPYVKQGKLPPKLVDEMIRKTCLAVLGD